MRKIIVAEFITLDGVIQAPGGAWRLGGRAGPPKQGYTPSLPLCDPGFNLGIDLIRRRPGTQDAVKKRERDIADRPQNFVLVMDFDPGPLAENQHGRK